MNDLSIIGDLIGLAAGVILTSRPSGCRNGCRRSVWCVHPRHADQDRPAGQSCPLGVDRAVLLRPVAGQPAPAIVRSCVLRRDRQFNGAPDAIT